MCCILSMGESLCGFMANLLDQISGSDPLLFCWLSSKCQDLIIIFPVRNKDVDINFQLVLRLLHPYSEFTKLSELVKCVPKKKSVASAEERAWHRNDAGP